MEEVRDPLLSLFLDLSFFSLSPIFWFGKGKKSATKKKRGKKKKVTYEEKNPLNPPLPLLLCLLCLLFLCPSSFVIFSLVVNEDCWQTEGEKRKKKIKIRKKRGGGMKQTFDLCFFLTGTSLSC